MTEDGPVQSEIIVRGQKCRVTAVRHRRTWRATGKFRWVELMASVATSPQQAFEWWTNKAEMQQMA